MDYDSTVDGSSEESKKLALSARRSALRMCSAAGAAHIGSSLSMIDLLAVLYSGGARISPVLADDPERDIVIISKGHAAAGTYAVLAHAGFFPLEWLDRYCQDGSVLGGHVTRGSVPGVEFSTGSLGHGLPFGVGVALGRARRSLKGQVFVVMSDGELDEGSNWEASLVAGHHYLGNLTVLIDRNGLQSLGTTESTARLEPLAEKWVSFGWSVRAIDGHDHIQIRSVVSESRSATSPTVVVANTTKGKGVSFMENQLSWHYRPPSFELLSAALAELDVITDA